MRRLKLLLWLSLSVMSGAVPLYAQTTFTTIAPGRDASVSGDGRYVVYRCPVTSFSPGEAGLCVYDLETSVEDVLTTERIVNPGVYEQHVSPFISFDGRFVVYVRSNDHLTGPTQIYLLNRETSEEELISLSSGGVPAEQGATSISPSVTPDGRFVVFVSNPRGLIPNIPTTPDQVFVRDRMDESTEMVSVDESGDPAEDLIQNAPAISDDGRYVSFITDAALVATDSNGGADAYVRDRQTADTIRVSELSNGADSDGEVRGSRTDISGNGTVVVFCSDASNLAPEGPSSYYTTDLFAAEIGGDVRRIHVAEGGTEQSPAGFEPDSDACESLGSEDVSVSADGRFVLFLSEAGNLIAGDPPGQDIYLRDRATNTNHLVGADEIGSQLDFDEAAISMSDDGRVIAIGLNTGSQILVRDRGDTDGPEISGMAVMPDRVTLGVPFQIVGTASEDASGLQDVASAGYQVDGGPWLPMTALDGAYDSPNEDLFAVVDSAGMLLGTRTVCVRAEDGAGNVSSPSSCAEVIILPEHAAAPGLRVRCTHSPIWPQPGDDVTIIAEGFPDSSFSPALTADEIEIWFNDNSAYATATTGSSSHSFLAANVQGESFAYGCRIQLGGYSVFSGWKRTQVGLPETDNPLGSRAIPVVYTGPLDERIDIVFAAHGSQFSESDDPNFLELVEAAIWRSFLTRELFLYHQNRFNFWIARDLGGGNGFDDGNCSLFRPKGPFPLEYPYPFADTVGMLHTMPQPGYRDCAKNGMFSAWMDTSMADSSFLMQVVIHETGHRPFGLMDEYCCDGGYSQEKVPNLYTNLDACTADAANVGRGPATCKGFIDVHESESWYRSDPGNVGPMNNTADDLMVSNGRVQALDARRIVWLLVSCSNGEC